VVGQVGGRASYPKDYFKAHPTRGFDIREGALGTHRVREETYTVWSNRFGCFDQEWQEIPRGYFYFAGDSFTWGYSPFEGTFPTLFQAKTAIPSLKCGVSHTGTLHQFEKFKDILAQVGHIPRRVIVGYYHNDIENDYLHPHSTVIKGWLVDQVFLDEQNDIIRVDRGTLEQWVQERLSETGASKPSEHGFQWLRHYSLSTNVIYGLLQQSKSVASNRLAPLPFSDELNERIYNGQKIHRIYSLTSGMTFGAEPFKYLTSKYADNNRNALKKWQRHARENNYQLVLMLIPPARHYISTDFFFELRTYLTGLGINFIDLTGEFQRLRVPRDQLYRVGDGHFLAAGNGIVSDILARRFRS
jgi:hypothetical protein